MHFSTRNPSLFPLSARPFTHAKADAFAKAYAMASNNGKGLARGFTPFVDMSCVKFFGPLDEVDTLHHPCTPSALDKIRRAAMDRFEEECQKTASDKARDERIAQVEWENKKYFARKRLEEADRQARKQALMAARKNAPRAAIRRPRKRKRNAFNAVEAGGRSQSISQASTSLSTSTPTNSDTDNSNGQRVIVESSHGTRIFHGKARHRPMVIDSDDEEALLPSPKRCCSSNSSSTNGAVGDKTQGASNGILVRGCSDRQPVNGEQADGNDADLSDYGHLDQKHRRYQHVRRESDKKNTPNKIAPKVTTQGTARGVNTSRSGQ
ncbi:hypothetical protein AYL99_04481 [Fonsecaea erecta]|uniref:Uncharacterized protein n=1 Tax=Fonsecaea erecta TaxID=1367422 RepID=A0A178ZR14_9EURO|nr:hypothetical protein AYL99_04481 [Fonsecaea erecta]OAP62278.1 hypothetical protein AYL99_04481 [Fonsecaea erecta]